MKDNIGSAVQAEQRRLAAIMFTDIVGFSRQMGSDETRMLRVLDVHNQLIQQAVADHHGHVIKTMGAAFLVDFPSVVQAVSAPRRFKPSSRRRTARRNRSNRLIFASAFTWAISCRRMAMSLAMA
jgi:class 3 adenylate cyclase